MPTGTLTAPQQPAPEAESNRRQAEQTARNPFTRATREVVEPFGEAQRVLSAALQNVSDVEVPPFGFLRNIVAMVDATGGAGGGAVAHEDAPWNVLQDVQVTDTNGRPLSGPVTGFDLYLKEKWLPGSAFDSNLTNSPYFQAVDANGNFRFLLRIPVEVSIRDALGSLPNQNASAEYRLSYSIAPSTVIYTAAPVGNLPTIRVRFYLEAWSPAEAADPNGVANLTHPPAEGTTQHVVKSTPVVQAGEQRVRLTRVGNMIRGLILVLRSNAAPPLRTTDDFPQQFRIEWDTRNLAVIDRDLLRHYMWERSGYQPDAGVIVLDFAHDFDGRTGNEIRDQWLPTTGATRLDIVGTFGAATGALQVITNDVAPAASI